MAPLTERFEMRLDSQILEEVDNWRSEQPDVPTRAEAMRRLVELGLTKSSGKSISVTDGEKILLMMMHDVYQKLGIVRGEIDSKFVVETICDGHLWAPKWKMPGLFDSHVDDPRNVEFVVQVLEMWDYLEESYENLTKKEKAEIEKAGVLFGKDPRFLGFDGHNDIEFLGIARCLVEQLDRFSRFKNRDLDSHMPTSNRYRRMLQAYAPIRAKYLGGNMNVSQIIKILKADD